MRHYSVELKREATSRSGFLRLLLVSLVPFFVFFCLPVAAWSVDEDLAKEPITITADRLETFQGGKQIIFSGSVKARQGSMTVESEKLLIHYLPGADSGEAVPDRGIERIEAEGSVIIHGDSFTVTGDHALLVYEEQIMIVTGEKAVLTEGGNVVEGDKITWHMTEERGVVEDSKTGRVKATIQPADN